MNTENRRCGELISFFAGEMTPEEREAFERHLSECPACREELKQLRRAWNAIPYSMDTLEPPEELKAEVLGAILQQPSGEWPGAVALNKPTSEQSAGAVHSGPEGKRPVAATEHEPTEKQPAAVAERERSAERTAAAARHEPVAKQPGSMPTEKRFASTMERGRRRSARFAAAAVLFILLLGYAGWLQFAQRTPQAPQKQPDLHLPARVLGEYSLRPFDPSMPSARGQAWLMEQGGSLQLVLQTSGLPELQGEQAYQVWLVKNGNRINGGTFRVDARGNGVLTYKINEADRSFETIGITLEPDPTGEKPRGKKVLGS